MTLRLMAFCTLLGLSLSIGGAARAQTVIGTVNDDPITNVDVEQHSRMLRVLHKDSSREAAFESVVDTRLKLIETSKFKINPADADIGWAIGLTARPLKMEPQALLVSLQRAGVTEDQWKQKFKADAAWLLYVRALNRTVEISETEVRGELARQGKSRGAEYTVRQVILVAPNDANGAQLQALFQEAQGLRAKFTDCATGPEIVRATRDGAIKEPVTRSASALADPLRQVLEKTEIGHLTPPNRGPQGIEMLALCGKADREDASAAETVRSDMLMKKMEGEAQRRFSAARAKAIIVRK